MTVLANLIPESRLRARRTGTAIRTWLFVHCVCIAVLGATWGVLAGMRNSEADTLRKQLNLAKANTTAAQTELKRASTELANLTRQIAAVPDVRQRPEWGLLLGTLGSVRGDAVALSNFDLSPFDSVAQKPGTARTGLPSRYQLKLSGLARDHRSATAFSLAVERTGLFSQVRLTDATAQNITNGTAVAFSIECTLEDAGGDQ